jgi:hypothetical protein
MLIAMQTTPFKFSDEALSREAERTGCLQLLYGLSTLSLCNHCLNGDCVKGQMAEDLNGDRSKYGHIMVIGSFGRRQTMWDIGCVGASALFFVIAIGYAMACDRLGAKEMQR